MLVIVGSVVIEIDAELSGRRVFFVLAAQELLLCSRCDFRLRLSLLQVSAQVVRPASPSLVAIVVLVVEIVVGCVRVHD